jgi:two-component system cell cycle sensor histidine kinase/response regulator CckA
MDTDTLNVLLIDDREDTYLVTQELLSEISRQQVRLTWAGSYEAGWEALRSGDHDVCLLDYRLGERSGLDLLRQAVGSGCPSPIIFITGEGGHAVDVEAMKAGAADYLVKGRLDGFLLERSIRYAIERKRAAEEVRESEERFRALVENNRDAILLLTGEGIITYASHSIARLLSCDVQDVLGAGVFDLTHPADLDLARHLFQECLRRPGESIPVEFRCGTGDGSWRSIEGVYVNRLEEPAVRAVIANWQDVTDRRRAEEALLRSEDQLRQSQKMEAVGRLAGGVAHHFNNLLTVINGYSEVLLSRAAAEDPSRAPLEAVREAGQRAAQLTRQILDFSHAVVPGRQMLDLREVVARMERSLRELAGERVEVTIAPPARLGRVKANPEHMQQVITNLAANACEAMPQGGQLAIEVRDVSLDEVYASSHPGVQPGPYVLLAVRDTGCGMDSVTVAHIFEPFFTTKEPTLSSGLGLSTVYGIVERSGGHVDVQSQPGKGTTMRVYLPRVTETGQLLHAARPRVPLARGSETVLLVEDEPAVRRFVRGVLQASGYTLLEASEGEEALSLCEQHQGPIHLLLTDVIMPGMNGGELGKRFSAARPQGKVVYTSGFTDEGLVEAGILQEGAPFLQKPFSVESLAHKVREVLDSGASAPVG